MTKEQYADLRLRPEWQKKRLEVFDRDGWACIECGDREATLNVHHAYYIKGRMPWDYPMWSLATYCKDCHKEVGHQNPEALADWEFFVSKLATRGVNYCGDQFDLIRDILGQIDMLVDEGQDRRAIMTDILYHVTDQRMGRKKGVTPEVAH